VRTEIEFNKLRDEKLKELEAEIMEWNKEKKSLLQPEKNDVIEMNIGGTHKINVSRTTLTKYQNSLLASLFTEGNQLTIVEGKVFIDRDGEPFAQMINFLRSGKVPLFSTKDQELLFRRELEFWQIPAGPSIIENSSNVPPQFDAQFCAPTLLLEQENRVVKKNGPNHGIVFVDRQMDSSNSYIEFKVTLSI